MRYIALQQCHPLAASQRWNQVTISACPAFRRGPPREILCSCKAIGGTRGGLLGRGLKAAKTSAAALHLEKKARLPLYPLVATQNCNQIITSGEPDMPGPEASSGEVWRLQRHRRQNNHLHTGARQLLQHRAAAWNSTRSTSSPGMPSPSPSPVAAPPSSWPA